MYFDKFWFEEMLKKIMERFDRIDEKLQIKRQEVQPLDGDRLLDNQDMCQLLGVTKRTVARYRQKKLIRFYTIRGKVWYRASEVAEFLKKKGKL
jgi:excisionase family DNA binding protein